MGQPETDATWLHVSLNNIAQVQSDVRRLRRNGYRVDLVFDRDRPSPSGGVTRELVDVIVYEPPPGDSEPC